MKHDAGNTKPCRVYVNGYELNEVMSFDTITGMVEVCTMQILDDELINAEVRAKTIIVEYTDNPDDYYMVYPEFRSVPSDGEVLKLFKKNKNGTLFSTHLRGGSLATDSSEFVRIGVQDQYKESK